VNHEKGICLSATGDERQDCEEYRRRLLDVSQKMIENAIFRAIILFPSGARSRMAKIMLAENISERNVLDPDLSSSPEDQVIRLQFLGRYLDALKMLNRLIQKYPGRAKLFSDRAVQNIYLGNCYFAKSDLEKALSLDPGDVSAQMNYNYLKSTGFSQCKQKTGIVTPSGKRSG
jgi:tetratricopeptide (TPR) repeat protein